MPDNYYNSASLRQCQTNSGFTARQIALQKKTNCYVNGILPLLRGKIERAIKNKQIRIKTRVIV